MIRFDKLTLKGQEALQSAQSHAQEKGNPQVAPEHLLWALVEQKEGVVLPILQKLGVNLQTVARDLADLVAKLPKVQGQAEVQISPSLNRILEDAFKEADQFKDEYVSTEHLLIALSNAKSEPVSRLLQSHGVTKDAILKVLVSIRGTQKITDQNPEEKYQALQRYSRDLTELARKGKLDPVIGRDEEIRRVIQVLSRRTKNNPVLIGEPGVGKTAIVEGLALRLVTGDVPETLKNKRLVALDIRAIVARSKYRGGVDDRLKVFLKENREADGPTICLITELHTIASFCAPAGALAAAPGDGTRGRVGRCPPDADGVQAPGAGRRRAKDHAARDRRGLGGPGHRRRRRTGPPGPHRRRDGRAEGEGRRAQGALAGREGRHGAPDQGEDGDRERPADAGRGPARGAARPGRLEPRRRDPAQRAPAPREGAVRARSSRGPAEGRRADGPQRGRRGGHRGHRREVDGHPGHATARGRDAEAPPDGAAARSARGRPGGGDPSRRQRAAAGSLPPFGSPHSHALGPPPRADGRRQDRDGARARRVPLRRRAGDDPHRHVRVQGAPHGGSSHRRAARIYRVRRGRPAD